MMLFIFDCEIHVRENVCHRFRPDGQIYLFKREYKKKKKKGKIENHEGKDAQVKRNHSIRVNLNKRMENLSSFKYDR